ncbi:MAG TPA: protein kinase [Gaiellaceae bacterium]|jgi:serine/threonine protein kinase
MAVDTKLLPPRYRDPERIGSGAMGEIFLATDETLGRRVAIKMLAERYAWDESIRQRFTREGLAAARLAGEAGTVTVFDVGEWNGRPFIVMEHVAGGSLEDRLRRSGAQPPGQALAWLEQAAAALDAAHRKGIVHRDVKPANLLLDGRGDVHVADFGIASAAGLESLTLTGTVLGTAGYLSPEQAQGERAGPASDRYALAVVAYELLTGHRPFESDAPTVEAAAHVHAAVPSIAEHCEHLPPELDPVFRRALAKDPRARYGTAADFVTALREALARGAGTTVRLPPATAPPSPPARGRHRTSWPLWALAALLIVAAGTGVLLAALLAGGDGSGKRVLVRTVVKPSGKTTTLRETVTQQQSAPAPAPPPPPPAVSSDGHSLNDRGYTLMQRGNYASALPYFEQAVRKLQGTGPGDLYEGYANYNLGYTLYRLGRCSEAVRYLRRAEQLEPDRHEPRDARKRAEKC